jgi:hypothetical protein
MYLRMKRAIEARPYRYIDKELAFSDGQTISVMGSNFCMHISEDERRSCSGRLHGAEIHISLPKSLPSNKRDKWVSSITRRLVYKPVKARLVDYVEGINKAYFNSEISDVRMHGGSSRWGVYMPDGSISLSFKLFFMPQECLEYVVVHELAHTRVRGHSRRFWKIVESVIPDYKARRKLLSESEFFGASKQGACACDQ